MFNRENHEDVICVSIGVNDLFNELDEDDIDGLSDEQADTIIKDAVFEVQSYLDDICFSDVIHDAIYKAYTNVIDKDYDADETDDADDER